MNKQPIINETLVQRLIAAQFPQWKDFPIRPVTHSGWDNRTFHLGEHMLVRMPSAEDYALQVEKEQRWLPKLAPLLPLPAFKTACTVSNNTRQLSKNHDKGGNND